MSLDLAWDDTTKNLPGTTESDSGATLTRSTGSPSTFVMKYRLHIALDSAAYDKDEVEVHLPMVLGNYRDGTSVTLQPTNIGIGQNPDAATPDVPFYYQVEGSDCVIRNARDLNQALSVSIEVAFTVDPIKIEDGSAANVTATGSFPDDAGTTQTVSAQPLTYITDTQTVLDDFYFPANQTKSVFEWGSTMPEPTGGYTLDTLHYRYVMYTTLAYAPDAGYNQPYSLKVQLDSVASGGTLIHASSSGMTYDPSSKSLSCDVTEDETRNISYLSKSKKYYKFLVAYPRNAGDPDTLSYPATFTCTVTPADGKDPATSKTATSTYTWKDYRFDYIKNGEMFDLSKGGTTGQADGYEKALSLLDQGIDADSLLYTVTGKGRYYPKTGDPQYPDTDESKRIGMTLVDDLMYLHTSGAATGDMVRLSPDDCSLNNVSVALTNYITNRLTGSKTFVSNLDAQYPGIKLSVSYKTKSGGDAWSAPTDYSFNRKNYVNDIPIPEGAYAVKIDLPAVFQDSIDVELKVNYSLKHDSPAYTNLRNLNDPAQSVLVLNNFCGLIPSVSSGAAFDTSLTEANYGGDSQSLGLPQYDFATYGKYLLRANKMFDLKSLIGDAVFGKFATGNTDSMNGIAYTEYQMDAVSGYRSSSSLTQEQYDQLVEKGLPSASLDNVVFYDLLPRGAYLATDSARAPSVGRLLDYSGTTAPCDVQVSVIDNYRGTGRQMVKIEVDSGLAPGKNVQQSLRCYQTKDSYVAVSGKVSGFTVKLWMAVPFSEAGLVNGAKNNAAFQKAEGALVGGYSDRSRDDMRCPDTGENPVLEDVQDAHGNSAFYNLAEKPAGPDENLLNTMYAADTVTLSHSISYGDGLTNFVKPDTFVDDALFSQSASVLIGQPYIFRMSLISGSKQISNAILFNNFGKASVDGKQSTWTGTFESIDLSNATIRGIAPVVYYTTEENAPYFTADDTRMRAVPAAWTTVKPSNPADIKGLAVDLSHATDGSEYAIPLQQAIGVYVTMRAPSTLPSPDAEEYNQAAYYAKIDGVAHNPNDSTLSAPPVTTRLIEPKLIKSNAPDFDTWVKAGDTITYTLSYTNEATETHPLVLEDAAPAGTTLAPAGAGSLAGNPTIEVNGAPVTDAATVDTGTGSITWKANVPTGQTATATFQVVVKTDAHGQIENQGDAAVRDAATSTDTPFSSNTVQNRIRPVLKKAVTGGTQGTDQHAYPGDVLTYELRYTNDTSQDQKVSISDAAPMGTTLANSTGNPTINVVGTASTAGNTVTWDIPVLQPGKEAVVTFQVVVNDDAVAGSTIANTGTVVVDNGSVTVDSNEVTTPVDPKPAVSKSVAGGTATAGRTYPGDVLTYTLGYTNESTSAQKVVLRDAAPTGTHFVPAEGGELKGAPTAKLDGVEVAGAASFEGDGLAWTFDSVGAGSIVTATFQVVVDDSAAGTDVTNVGGLFLNGGTAEVKTNEVTTPVDPKPKPDPDPDPPTEPDPPDDPAPPDNPKPNPEPEPTPPTDGGQTPEQNPETKPLDTTKATPTASQSDQPRTGDLPPFVFAGLAGIAAIAAPTAILAARRSKRTQR